MENKRHLMNGRVAGFSYWDGAEAFEHLKVGTKLTLVREPDNRFDPYAVALYFEEYKLGFVPRDMNHELSKYLDMGYEDIYDVRVNRLSSDAHPEEQVGFIIRIKNRIP